MSADLASAQLIALARRQLKLPFTASDADVPKTYVPELQQHLLLTTRDDDNFEVVIEPRSGLGRVKCLEEGCGQTIELSRRTSANDGSGIEDGFGSLIPYTQHCSSVSHVKGKITRLLRDGKRSNVKAEPIEYYVPQKRVVKDENDSDSLPVIGHQTPMRKKPKREPATPLSPRQTNIPRHQSPFSPGIAFTDSRGEVLDVASRITNVKRLIDRLQSKEKAGSATKADVTRIRKYRDELGTLERQKKAFNTVVPDVKPKYEAPAFRNPIVDEHSKPTLAPWKEESDDDMDIDTGLDYMTRFDRCIPRIAPVEDNLDENEDYYGRGRDRFQGPKAEYGDLNQFFKEAGNAERFDSNESVTNAVERLGLKSQYDLLPGMEVSLMPHQTIGVAWLLDKEQSSFKGGALGDDMGLGKTVQMIALILKNPSTDKKCKTTLIVAPTSLLDQWAMEIELKTSAGLNVHIYHGQSRTKSKKKLLEFDIVITSYGTMAMEWPDYEKEQKAKQDGKSRVKRKKKSDDDFIVDDDSDMETVATKKKGKAKAQKGLLFQVEFYRVILDEAQAVRNKRTRYSRSVTDLDTRYRWCLTGTPIVNSLTDAYGYLRFLKVRPWYDWDEFNGHIALIERKQPNLATRRLQAIFSTILLRRMKDSKLDGKKLIELPAKKVEITRLEFTEEEREIYSMVESKSQDKFNRYLRAGTVLKNYQQVLVLLLRLRQICAHPCLIQEEGVNNAFVDADNFEDLKPELASEVTRARRLVGAEFVVRMKNRFRANALRRIEAEKNNVTLEDEEAECPVCNDAMSDSVLLACTHIMCRECPDNVLNEPLMQGLDEEKFKKDERACPTCKEPFSPQMVFSKEAFNPSEAEISPIVEVDSDDEMEDAPTVKGKVVKKAPKGKKTKSRFAGSDSESDYEDEDDMSDFIVQSDEDEEEKDAVRESKRRLGKRKNVVVLDSDDEMDETPEEKEVLLGVKKKEHIQGLPGGPVPIMSKFLPSTKLKYMMDHVDQLMDEKPDEKYLVISQWTACLSLVSNYLTEKGIAHVKYQGDMNRLQRDTAVRVFMSKEKAKIMLMSLKCGGVGLNLTRANNVINLDPAWNASSENQAFDRVHRLGQHREVSVQRLIVDHTVEDRLLALQERKQSLADGCLGEGGAKKIGRLSVAELAGLFGLDARGRQID